MADVVRLLNCHPNTVRRATESGVLPCYRLSSGGGRRFKLSDVRKYLGENTDSLIDDGELKQGKQFSIPIAAVIRVSSAKQGTARGESDKSSLEHQEQRIAAFIKQRFGNRSDVTWYRSIGGGLDWNRPALVKLIGDIVQGKFRNGWIIAQDFTRLARFGVQMIEHLAKLGGCQILYTMDEAEAEAKGYAEQLTDEILSILTHYTAKASGEKARKILTVRVPADVVQTIYTLGKAGYSYRYIAQELARQGKGRGECGREITKRVVERILKEHGDGLRLLEANSDATSLATAANSFVEFFTANVRLTGQDDCRCRQSVLIDRYREWCKAQGKAPMTSNSIRKTLRKHFPQLSTKFTDNACIQYTGMTIVTA